MPVPMSSLRDSGKGLLMRMFCYNHFTPAGVWILLIQNGEIILEIIMNVILKHELLNG
jgi:hypothetical protein